MSLLIIYLLYSLLFPLPSFCTLHPESYSLPPPVINSTLPLSALTNTITDRPLDTLYLPKPNATSYEWWYFDAVAPDLCASIVLQPVVENGSFELALDLSYVNGKGSRFYLPTDEGYFSTTGEGANIRAANGEWGFESSADGGFVKWDLDLREAGINGTVEFLRVTPPHTPCAEIEEGAGLEIWWNLMWINTMPHAVAKVDLSINDTAWAFEGAGYHDQNWGVYPYYADLDQWYWGHGRTEDYSVVWFYRISPSGIVRASAYISQEDHIIYAGCGGSVTVRITTDQGTVYPLPFGFNRTVTGLEMSIDAGDEGQFAFTATRRFDVLHSSAYDRWIGEFGGGLVGAGYSTGVALWELMGPFETPGSQFGGGS